MSVSKVLRENFVPRGKELYHDWKRRVNDLFLESLVCGDDYVPGTVHRRNEQGYEEQLIHRRFVQMTSLPQKNLKTQYKTEIKLLSFNNEGMLCDSIRLKKKKNLCPGATMAQAQVMPLNAIKDRLTEVKTEVDTLKQSPIEGVSRSRLVTISTELREIAKQITKQSVCTVTHYL